MTFLSLIKSGIITYDWRGYTSKTGKYSGKNHGNGKCYRGDDEHKGEGQPQGNFVIFVHL